MSQQVTTMEDLDSLFSAPVEIMTPEKFKNSLNRLRFEFSDEIPETKVNSTTPAPEGFVGWKVRASWFLQIANLLSIAYIDGLLNNEEIQAYEEFAKYIQESKEEITSRQEIDFANRLLDQLLERLGS